MTEPTGGPPSPQPPQGPPPQAAPPPQAVPPPQAGGGNWTAPPPSSTTPGGFQTQADATEAGPAPGVAYADLVNRIVAFVIDAFIVGFVGFLVTFIFNVIGAAAGFGLVTFLVGGLIAAAISAVYFIYGWTRMRASLGQKFLNLETVGAADGATLTQDQAIRRWLWLYGPYALTQIIPIVGFLLSFLVFFYALYLLYTASQSPKRQGYHDVQANTVVIKRLAA